MAKVMTPKRHAKLLSRLEDIIANECYHGKIQNWGAYGSYGGEGRVYRYPITFVDSDGNKIKRRSNTSDIDPKIMQTGYYAFGTNQLRIIRALDKILTFLEEEDLIKVK